MCGQFTKVGAQLWCGEETVGWAERFKMVFVVKVVVGFCMAVCDHVMVIRTLLEGGSPECVVLVVSHDGWEASL